MSKRTRLIVETTQVTITRRRVFVAAERPSRPPRVVTVDGEALPERKPVLASCPAGNVVPFARKRAVGQ